MAISFPLLFAIAFQSEKEQQLLIEEAILKILKAKKLIIAIVILKKITI